MHVNIVYKIHPAAFILHYFPIFLELPLKMNSFLISPESVRNVRCFAICWIIFFSFFFRFEMKNVNRFENKIAL